MYDYLILKLTGPLKDMGIRCKRPKKLELEHDDGPDYDEEEKEKSKELQKQVASALS